MFYRQNRWSFAFFPYIVIIWCLLNSTISSCAQIAVPPPHKVWLSLGFSSLDAQPPNWTWLHNQCVQGHVLKTLTPLVTKNKVGALIVPVFDDGKCFYTTNVVPFKGRNPGAITDETALHELLASAHKAGIPIYLGINVLSWQKNISKSGGARTTQSTPASVKLSNIFSKVPDSHELNLNLTSSPSEAAYSSPFNPRVRSIMATLLREVATKFPEATGIVLDLRLSDHEVLGYSETARAAAINDVTIDPLDLTLSLTGSSGISPAKRQWLEWRRGIFSLFLKSLSNSYRQGNLTRKVLVSGNANYYGDQVLSDLHTGQDWLGWTKTGDIDGVLVEGHWLPRFNDNRYFNASFNQITMPSAPGTKGMTFIPVTSGKHLDQDTDYQKDWVALKSHINNLNQLMLLVKSDDDLKKAVALSQGEVVLSMAETPQVGGVMPDFELRDTTAKLWNSSDLVGTHSLFLMLANNVPLSTPISQSIVKAMARLQDENPIFLVVSSSPVLNQVPNSVVNLMDQRQALLSLFGAHPTLVLVDNAGFIRHIQPVPDTEALVGLMPQLDNPTPKLEEGKPAPDFSIVDMNGAKIRLAALRGKKNLLLTFFPKCFTGG